MPWPPQEAHKFKKGLSPESAKKWSRVANSVLAKTGNERQAIRVASGVTKGSLQRKIKRSATGDTYRS